MAQIIIGIVVYKNTDYEINRCFDSIARQTAKEKITGVAILDNDNGSARDKVFSALECYGLIEKKLFYLSTNNCGFGTGHNKIFRNLESGNIISSAYLCLNSDAILHPDCINQLIIFAENHQWQGLFEAQQFPVQHPKKYDPLTGITQWCSGCCLLIPQSIHRKLDGFDESFFLYCEDVDISWRARALGYLCYTIPSALVHHDFMNRDDDKSNNCQIWLSAYKLAHKWRSNKFKKRAYKYLIKTYDLSFKDMEMISLPPQIDLETILKGSPDFYHGLHFSPTFW